MNNKFPALRKSLWLLPLATFPLVAESGQAQVLCGQAAFTQTPVDTPVLPGSTATFFSAVNGPWPIQWYENGSPIAGATNASFTTEVITNGNSTNVYSVGIVGCSGMSPVAHTLLFTPSTTESVGIQFGGGGTNGAPVYMAPSDIAGVQQQAYWNPCTNVATNSGNTGDGVTLPRTLVDSSNNPTPITFSFATSTNWGAGAPTEQPVGRLLNGIAGATGPGAAQTFTWGHLAANQQYSVIVYSLAPPSDSDDMSFSLTNSIYTNNAPTVYEDVLNSTKYNAAPGFYRATSTYGPTPSIGDLVRFDNIVPDANGDITLTVNASDDFSGAIGVNAIQLLANPPSVGAPPVIVTQPQSTVAASNGILTLTVAATGSNLTYQWRKSGVAVPNAGAYSGANTATLTISPFTGAETGIYSVAVFNEAGSAISGNAATALTDYQITNGLVAYWPFDQVTGSNAPNAVPGGLPVQFIATVAWAAGQISNAVVLDGQTTVGYVPSYRFASNAIAGTVWVNVNWHQYQAIDPGGNISLFRNMQSFDIPPTTPEYFGQFSVELFADSSTGLLQAAAFTGNFPPFAGVYAPVADEISNGWHHIAFSADGVQVKLYLDGTNVAAANYAGNLITAPSQPWLAIGGWLYTDTNAMPYPVALESVF